MDPSTAPDRGRATSQANQVTKPRSGDTRSEPIDTRYRATKPSTTKRPEVAPTADRPSAAKTSTGTKKGSPPAAERYAPRATGSSAGNAKGQKGVLAPSKAGATTSKVAPSDTVISKSPRLVPRTDSPRLQPRTNAPLTSGVVGTVSSGCFNSSWNCWSDPCHFHWGWPHCGWSSWGGCGSFCWGFSWWYPWCWYSSCYWNSCYSSCWWNTCSYPYYPSYWWYPSTTYCPAYLYVPNTVVVEGESSVPSAEPAQGEPIAGGGGVSNGQPSEGKSGEVKSNEATPESLARKYVELGDYYFKAGRFAEAVDAYSKARSYAPDDASVHFVLADAVFATGDYHFAAFLIAEALRLDPALASAETDKRSFYGDPKVFDAQMEALDRYLDIKPYDAQAHLVRGYNLRFSDKKDAAIAAFRRVLEIAEIHAAQVFLDALVPKAADAPAKV